MLRYYYNLDVGINFGYLTHVLVDNNTYRHGHFSTEQVHTLNFDLIFNTHSWGENTFAFILGAGMGLSSTKREHRYKATQGGSNPLFFNTNNNVSRRKLVGFRAQANVGIQWMKQSYGLELMAKIPLTPPLQYENNILHNREFSRYKPYFTLTIDFIKPF